MSIHDQRKKRVKSNDCVDNVVTFEMGLRRIFHNTNYLIEEISTRLQLCSVSIYTSISSCITTLITKIPAAAMSALTIILVIIMIVSIYLVVQPKRATGMLREPV